MQSIIKEGRTHCHGVRGENRAFTRYQISAPATVWRQSARVAGELVDISLGGAYLKVASMLALNEAVTVSVHQSIEPLEMVNDLPATVVRSGATGCAIRFDRMLIEEGLGISLGGPRYRIP